MPPVSLLPHPVARFVVGINTADMALVLSQFVDDAIVNDQLREYCGVESIRGWVEQDCIGKALEIDVVHTRRHYGQMILTGRIEGEFDKRGLPDPLLLTFYFTQDGGKVVQLIVLPKTYDRETDT
jgi:hypothetical protein